MTQQTSSPAPQNYRTIQRKLEMLLTGFKKFLKHKKNGLGRLLKQLNDCFVMLVPGLNSMYCYLSEHETYLN